MRRVKVGITRILFVPLLFGVALFAMSVAMGYGFIITKTKSFPYNYLQKAVLAYGESIRRAHYLNPQRFDRAGAEIHDREAMAPGVTLLTSYWPETGWRPGIRLIDADGTVLHHWNVRPELIWPDPPYEDHVSGVLNQNDNYVHGTWLLPDGDILLSIEYLGLQRLNSCGEVIWKLPYRTHHSIHRADDGNFWVPGFRWREERTEQFPGLVPPFGEDIALKVSPEGEVLKEISILKALFDSGYRGNFWRYRRIKDDTTHLNDIEPLPRRLADRFDSFEEGDLLISMRFLSAIAVMDQSGNIKWYAEGHFNNQHDPDFSDDGRIYVFDNRWDGSDRGRYLGGSAIKSIDPATDDVTTVYPKENSPPFHTKSGGKLQLLENGNYLITEARAARVFEVDAQGRIVWEWIQEPYDDDSVPEVLEGTRYELTPEQVAAWPCSEPQGD